MADENPAGPPAPAARPSAPATPAKPSGGAPAKAAPHPAAPAPPAGPPDPPPPATVDIPRFLVELQAAVPGGVTALSYWVGDWTVIVPTSHLIDVLRHLRDAPGAAFDMLSDVTAVDWPPRKPERFDLVYCLWSTRLRHRVRVKTRAADGQPVPSATALWPAADWLEREVFDMFGINLTGHPDRRRILMPEDWQGHPERKDYPLEGPGELLLENPIDWLKLRQTHDEMDIE
jgi:NADH-quinone oxidoreductase subunit C